MTRITKISLFILFGAASFLLIFQHKTAEVPPANYIDRDDAVITLSHARNLVDYGFIGVSPSGERVEGFSAPLQFWVATAAYAASGVHYSTFLRWQTNVGTLLLGALIAALLLVPASTKVWDVRDLFAVIGIGATAWILASSRAFLLWHHSGMENAYKSAAVAGVLLTLDAMMRRGRVHPIFVPVVFLATLTRIDAIVPVFMLLATFAVIWAYRFQNFDGLKFLAMSLLPWLLYMAWRRSYFGQWAPNTALAQAISVTDRLDLLIQAPGDAIRDYWHWFVDTGKSLQAFQFAWLFVLPVLVRRNGLALTRAAFLLTGSLACLAGYVCFGPARMDPARTVTELAIYSVLVVPFVLGGLADFHWRHFVAGVSLMGASAAVVTAARPDRTEVGWGTTWFETNADDVDALARQYDIPRPSLANPDLGAVSWRKHVNVIDLGRLGSVTIPRVQGAARFLAEFAKPDVIELHGAWSCTYWDLFTNRTFLDEYVAVHASASGWVSAHCPAAQGAKDGLWIRRAILKGSGSVERRFLDDFRQRLDIEVLGMELSRCLGREGADPCDYVGRTLFRFVPELKRAGKYREIGSILGRDHRTAPERAWFTSSTDPNWWRQVLVQAEPLALTPEILSLFSRIDRTQWSDAVVNLRDPAGVPWQVGAPSPNLFEIRPTSGNGDAVLRLVPHPTTVPIDAMVDVPFYLTGTADPRAKLTVRFKSLMPPASAVPFGAVDTPADPVTLTDATVTFQGWALDAFDVRRVRVAYVDGRTGKDITLGETRGVWKRPDIARLFPAAHDVYNSGWAFPLAPTLLSRVGRPVTINFYAESGDGRSRLIGSRTIE